MINGLVQRGMLIFPFYSGMAVLTKQKMQVNLESLLLAPLPLLAQPAWLCQVSSSIPLFSGSPILDSVAWLASSSSRPIGSRFSNMRSCGGSFAHICCSCSGPTVLCQSFCLPHNSCTPIATQLMFRESTPYCGIHCCSTR